MDGTVVFAARRGMDIRREFQLRCGQCIGCRLDRSVQWSLRVMHEAQLHEENSFVTLTYDDDHLPYRNSLDYRHFQLFMKSLRRRLEGRRIRFYMCGEYGERFERPHFHAVLFGVGFRDRTPIRRMESGASLYSSEFLSSVWTRGFASVGDVTQQSAAYVARYCMKKVTGRAASDHYSRVDDVTGEIFELQPEFSRMSLKPGIGADWFAKFHKDVFERDFVVMDGRKFKVPRYYDKRFSVMDPEGKDFVDLGRYKKLGSLGDDYTPDRLAVREVVQIARTNLLKRGLS